MTDALYGRLYNWIVGLEQQRDAAVAASNKDLEARREAHAEVMRYRRALAFARSCIKSGEPWTDTCEDVIGSLLR